MKTDNTQPPDNIAKLPTGYTPLPWAVKFRELLDQYDLQTAVQEFAIYAMEAERELYDQFHHNKPRK